MSVQSEQVQPSSGPTSVIRRLSKKGIAVAVASVLVLAAVAIYLGVRSGGNNEAQPTKVSGAPAAPAPESTKTSAVSPESGSAETTPPAEPELTVKEAAPEEVGVVTLDSKCFRSVVRCLEGCLKCEDDECEKVADNDDQRTTRTSRRPRRSSRRSAPATLAPPPEPPAVTPSAAQTVAAGGSCEGPSSTIGPEVAGLVVQGKTVTWTDPCYSQLVLYGEHGKEFPLVTFNAPSKRVTLPGEYLEAGYDRFSLRTPDGRWAFIHAGSGCVVDEGPRGHAYLLACN